MIKQFKGLFAQFGFKVTCAYIVHRVIRRLSKTSGCYYYYIYEQPFTAKIPTTIKRPANAKLSFEWFQSFNDIQLQLPRPEHIIKGRFEQETTCVFAIQEQQALACAWFTEKQYREDEVRCLFNFSHLTTHVWDYDVYVTPKYRVGRMFMRLWQQAEQYWQAQGFIASLSRINAFNSNSVTSHQKLGAKRIGSVCFLSLGGTQFMVSTLAPYVHLSFTPRTVPEIKVKLR